MPARKKWTGYWAFVTEKMKRGERREEAVYNADQEWPSMNIEERSRYHTIAKRHNGAYNPCPRLDCQQNLNELAELRNRNIALKEEINNLKNRNRTLEDRITETRRAPQRSWSTDPTTKYNYPPRYYSDARIRRKMHIKAE